MTSVNYCLDGERRVTDRVAAALRALWFGVIPALLAAVVMKCLLPQPVPGLSGPLGLVARAGRSAPVALGAGLFVLFSALARYWRFRLPGGRHLSGPSVDRTAARRRVAGTVVTIALAVGGALVLRARVAEPYRVMSASMLPTLEPGDQVVGNKLAYASASSRLPHRGDVVVFPSALAHLAPADVPPVLIKRVVGLPGDRIQMRGGQAIINGWQVPTCDVGEYLYLLPDGQGGAFHGRLLVEFLDGRAYLTTRGPLTPFTGTYEVKPDEVFVLGDNRANSFDSRAWNDGRGGGLPLVALKARVQWFLVGTRVDGQTDWRRTLRPIDSIQSRLHIEGIESRTLDEGIARCLKDPPRDTHPPPPGEGRVAPPMFPMVGSGM